MMNYVLQLFIIKSGISLPTFFASPLPLSEGEGEIARKKKMLNKFKNNQVNFRELKFLNNYKGKNIITHNS